MRMIELIVLAGLCLVLLTTICSFFLLSGLLSVAVFFRLLNLLTLAVLAVIFFKKYLFPWACKGIAEKRNLHIKYKLDKKNLQIEHNVIVNNINEQATYTRELLVKMELWRMQVGQRYEARDKEKQLLTVRVQDQSQKRERCIMADSMRSCVVPSAVFYARQKLIQKFSDDTCGQVYVSAIAEFFKHKVI